jgi:ribokinase
MAAVWNYGSINIDHVYQLTHLVKPGETINSQSYQQLLGGKGANQSVALAKAGGRVQHLGYIGRQDAWVKEALIGYGVDCKAVDLVDEPSGHAIIQVDEQGENAIIVFAGANRSQPIERTLDKMTPQKGDWFVTQNETNEVRQALQHAKASGMSTALNPSPFELEFVLDTLPLVDLLVVNEGEFHELLPGVAIESLDDASLGALQSVITSEWPDKTVVITMGSMGAVWISKDHAFWAAAPKVDVVDTTGAGDTFLGYLLAGISQGQSIEASMQQAVAASALSVQVVGAAQSIPDQNQVADYLASLPA